MGVAENGGMNGSMAYPEKGSWTIGLVNSKYKYLSAETFGFKVNANGTAMKKKQVWILEPYGDGDSICLRSHLNKYLAVDQFGNVTCENEEKDDMAKFEVSVCDDYSGRWAFRSVSRDYFLGASADNLVCRAKSPGDNELWYVHLAARPQVNLRSVGRKRFARLSEERTEIQVEENVPWGEDTLFTLEFREEANKYAIHTCNNMYLNKNGVLQPMASKDTLFACEYHGGYIALRDQEGLYLSPIGSRAVLKTRSNVVTKDELFSLEDSLPQASFIAAANTRYVSVKQGVDVTANQEEVCNSEMFQLEYEHSSGNWYIRTMQDKYFTLQPGGGVQASESKKSKEALFEILWHQDGSVSFKASNGKYLGTKKSGHLFANMDGIEENARFYFYLVNRPILVLKSDQGFVGYRTGTIKLECNKATYETIQVERGDLGIVFFKGQNDKYWVPRDGGIFCDSDTPKGFYLELREPTRMCIKTTGGQYIVSQKNGGFSAESVQPESATRWEY
eukprot:TRINITY_DN8325_c0_g2_i4.p1 TRINITY_DN8325_c0_g2~~TRINITY_DN8325_c0_g2_i4.p1  ORF type:complete len:505 (+),score=168.65 TRINITY_DN8325_c0_g2_i4:109-1623(+)